MTATVGTGAGCLLDWALSYARLGWPVFPLFEPRLPGCSCGRPDCSDAGKHPRTSRGFRDATTDPDVICTWWRQWPGANVGIATGSVSSLSVLDVDSRKGGIESLRRLFNGQMLKTWTIATGDGYHYYFRNSDRRIPSRSNAFGPAYPGLDVRSEGGYVVAAPSLHLTGVRYTAYGAEEFGLADHSPWLDLVATNTVAPGASHRGLFEGERNESLFQMGSAMRAKGFGEAAIQAALRAHNRDVCAPPLADAEVLNIARSW